MPKKNGDGTGFEPGSKIKLSLGIARVAGSPPEIAGANIDSPSGERVGDGKYGPKASGMLMLDGILYMWIRNANYDGTGSQLGWSTDHGRSWQWSSWKFTESFGCPTFLNFGRNYSGARDAFVYVYSHDDPSAYQPSDQMVLARVPRKELRNQKAYEFFAGLDKSGRPGWTADLHRRQAVFVNPGQSYRSGISFNHGLKRYLWCQIIGTDARFRGGFGIYESPEPWGPWKTVFYTREWDVGPGETCSLPTKWMSADGKTCYLLFSGDDSFSVRRVVFRTQ